MDNHRRPLEDYFNAARQQEGISEEEIRSILRDDSGAASGGVARRRRIAGWTGIGMALLVGGILLIPNGDPASPTVGARSGMIRDAAPRSSVAQGAPSPMPADAPVSAAGSDPMLTLATRPGRVQPFSQTKENRPMMTYPRMKGLLAGVAIASAAATSAGAQSNSADHAPSEKSPLIRQLEKEVASAVADYWEAKLNGYHSRIDAILSAEDRAELNKLRVRWGITMGTMGALEVKEGQKSRVQSSMVIETDEVTSQSNVSVSVFDTESSEGTETDLEDLPDEAKHLVGAYQRAKEMSDHYRPEFDRLSQDVMGDIVGFMELMHERGRRFLADNRAELEKTPEGRKVLAGMEHVGKVMQGMNVEGSKEMLTTLVMGLEPMIMLYNGGGVKGFFEQAGPVASVMPGWALEERSALKQCAPNPATTSAVITYQLQEPSSRTRLRLFSAAGEEVAAYDLGERPAGEGTVTVNVAALPPGTYLYHLTTASGTGEQVFSKTMQVAR